MFNTNKLCYNCFAERQDPAGACPYCGYDDMENREKYPVALKSGSILNGQYIVGRVLGQGGFGITYLAFDRQLNIKVAIKEYIPDGMATRLPETTLVSVYTGEKQDNFHYGAERFLDEARVLARFIGNKNIAAVKSYFNENNTAYFVMDYIEGISFKNYIKNKGGKVDCTDALRVLLPVMDALAAVHKEGLIHRDVTPDNIYITKDNEIKLLDFGSARYSLGDKSKSLDVILKAGYAPKEQYTRRGKQGPYTDIYSLAACFYASITGYLPPEALDRIDEDDIVDISTRGIKIPPDLEDAVMKGLEVRAEDRWQSVEEFRAAIEEGKHGGAEQASGQPKSSAQPESFVRPEHVTPPQDSVTSEQPSNSAIGNKLIAFIRKNKIASLVSAVACVVIILSVAFVMNGISGDGDNISTDGNADLGTTDYLPDTTSGDNLADAANPQIEDTEINSTESTDEPETAELPSDSEEAATEETAAEEAAAEEAAAEEAAAEEAAAEEAAAEEAAADKAAAEEAAADKAAAEEAAADKAAADKAAADKAAVDKAAADKAAADKAAADKAAAEKAANAGEFTLTFNGETHKYTTEDSFYYSNTNRYYDIYFSDADDSDNSISLDLPGNVSAGNRYKSNNQSGISCDLVTLHYNDNVYFLVEEAYKYNLWDLGKEDILSSRGYYVNYSTVSISEWGGSGGRCKGTFEAQIELAMGDIIDFTGSFDCKIPGNGFD